MLKIKLPDELNEASMGYKWVYAHQKDDSNMWKVYEKFTCPFQQARIREGCPSKGTIYHGTSPYRLRGRPSLDGISSPTYLPWDVPFICWGDVPHWCLTSHWLSHKGSKDKQCVIDIKEQLISRYQNLKPRVPQVIHRYRSLCYLIQCCSSC
jgi:hypothetical protein